MYGSKGVMITKSNRNITSLQSMKDYIIKRKRQNVENLYMLLRFVLMQAIAVVPEPMQLSSTVSPSLV